MIYKTFVILLSLTCLAGCAAYQAPTNKPPIHSIDWLQETPQSVLERVQIEADNIKILSAFFNLSMNPPPQRMMSSMSGVITIDTRDQQPKVRIQAFHLFGSILFDMVSTGSTQIYVPRKNTMYVGTKQEKKSKGPQTIFANMMLDPSHLIIADKSRLEMQTESVLLYLQDGWLKLDKQTGLITTRHKDDLIITYSAYAEIGGESFIPTKIRIETTDGQFTASCSLSNISTPENLPQTFFELSEYTPKEIKPLEELH